MNENRGSSEVTGTTSLTETSPLNQNERKKCWSFVSCSSEHDEGSVRTTFLNLTIFTVIVTIGLFVQIYFGGYQNVPHGSIASDSHECSEIGIRILKKGGSAVDAAIATTMCLGVVNFHITGLGGGGYMVVYSHKKRQVLDVLDFHATVPFSYENKPVDTSIDGFTVGVPGFLLGLWEAHQKFGKLPWQDIIMPASRLAKKGFLVQPSVISAKNYLKNEMPANKNLFELLNSVSVGEKITFPDLSDSLKMIATSGPQAFYNGSLAMNIVYSVKAANGNLSLEDISQYQTSHSELLHTRFGNFDVFTTGSSSGGALLLNALDTIQFLDLNSEDNMPSIVLKLSDVLHDTYISFLEKNDASPVRAEQVASQVSAMDVDELYVAVVTGLNTWLGSQLLTSAGFILNNALVNGGVNDERRPISLSTPVIAIESDEVCGTRLVLGSGDALIAAQVLTNAIVLKNNGSSSVEFPRFFVDNIPRHIRVEDLHEPFFSESTLDRLRQLLKIEKFPLPYKSINIIEKIGDIMLPHSDSRGGGQSSQYK